MYTLVNGNFILFSPTITIFRRTKGIITSIKIVKIDNNHDFNWRFKQSNCLFFKFFLCHLTPFMMNFMLTKDTCLDALILINMTKCGLNNSKMNSFKQYSNRYLIISCFFTLCPFIFLCYVSRITII